MDISSLQNPEIKNLVRIQQKSNVRKKEKRIVVEGIQENEYALQNAFSPEVFYVCETIFQNRLNLPSQVPIKRVSEKVYAKIAYRATTEGIVGVYHSEVKALDWDSISLILVLEGIEKPGNLGAIIRSSLAFGVDAILLSQTALDPYNPNVIRSSVGTVFSLPILSLQNEETLSLLNKNEFTLYGTDMHQEAVSLAAIQFDSKAALLFGTEHDGLSAFWKNPIDTNFLIPMNSNMDSLNLSNAVAISLFAYQTQKKPDA